MKQARVATIGLAAAMVVAIVTTRVTAQQPSWSEWRPAGELVGVRYFERTKDVTAPHRGSYVQWRLENSNTHGVYASVARKRYTLEGGKVDTSYPDVGRSLEGGTTFTFAPERTPTQGYVVRAQCTPVVATD